MQLKYTQNNARHTEWALKVPEDDNKSLHFFGVQRLAAKLSSPHHEHIPLHSPECPDLLQAINGFIDSHEIRWHSRGARGFGEEAHCSSSLRPQPLLRFGGSTQTNWMLNEMETEPTNGDITPGWWMARLFTLTTLLWAATHAPSGPAWFLICFPPVPKHF